MELPSKTKRVEMRQTAQETLYFRPGEVARCKADISEAYAIKDEVLRI